MITSRRLSLRTLSLCFTVLIFTGCQTPVQRPINYSVFTDAQLKPMVLQGNVDAIRNLLKRSHALQLHHDWLIKSAKLNNAAAQYVLSELLLRSKDVEQQSEGYVWLQRAAQNNYSVAQRYLGEWHLTGAAEQFDIVKDPDKAMLWLEKAAGQGNIRAHEILAGSFGYGTYRMELNFNKSRYHYQWLIEQVDEHPILFKYSVDKKAQQYREGLKKVIQFENNLYNNTDEVRRTTILELLNRSDVRLQVHALALQLLIKLGKEGDQHTQYELARIYALGRFNVAVNSKQSLYWYQQAAAQSHIEAMQDLMNAYGSGSHGISKDLLKARQLAQQLYEYQRQGQHGLVANPRLIKQRKKNVEYYDRIIEMAGGTFEPLEQLERRARKGEMSAQYQLARQLLSFSLLERGKEAHRWMKKAASSGHADANYQLYRFYDGHGFSLFSDSRFSKAKKKRLVLSYLKRAVELRHFKAIYVMANAYEKGNYGLKQDYHQAKKLYQQVVSASKEELSGYKTTANLLRMSISRIAVADRALKGKKMYEKKYMAATPLEKKIMDVKHKYRKMMAAKFNAICKSIQVCTGQYIRTQNKKIKNFYQNLRDAEIKKVRLKFSITN